MTSKFELLRDDLVSSDDSVSVSVVPVSSSENSGTHTNINKQVSTMSLVARFATAWIIAHIIYLAVDDLVLFSLHPACMTIGYLLFMMEAFLVFSPYDCLPMLRHVNKAKAHWLLQVGAITMILTGFLAAVVVKFQYDKPHFQSWHAFLGLLALCSVAGATCGGTATLYSAKIKSMIKPAAMKVIHASFGVLTLTLGLVTLCIGFLTNWFKKRANGAFTWIYIALIVGMTIRVLVGTVHNISVRLRNRK